jgi:hypothetical protein
MPARLNRSTRKACRGPPPLSRRRFCSRQSYQPKAPKMAMRMAATAHERTHKNHVVQNMRQHEA